MASISAGDTLKPALEMPLDFRETSEKLTHFWLGAVSPLWVPFFAATGFGLGSWAVAQALSPVGGRDRAAYGALPRTFTDALTAQYGWLKSSEPSAHMLDEAAEAMNEAAGTQARHLIDQQDAIVDAVLPEEPVVDIQSEATPEVVVKKPVRAPRTPKK